VFKTFHAGKLRGFGFNNNLGNGKEKITSYYKLSTTHPQIEYDPIMIILNVSSHQHQAGA